VVSGEGEQGLSKNGFRITENLIALEAKMRIAHKLKVRKSSDWALKKSEKLFAGQTVTAAKKNKSKPSNDRPTASRVLADSRKPLGYRQYKFNTEQAQTWIESSETVLNTVYSLFTDALNASLRLVNEGLESSDTVLNELQGIYDHLISLPNTGLCTTYMHRRNITDTGPFKNEVVISERDASDVIFYIAEHSPDVSIKISNSAGEVLRTLTVSGPVAVGVYVVAWDGLDDEGEALPNGTYEFTVTTCMGGDILATHSSYRDEELDKEIITGEDTVIFLGNDGGELVREITRTIGGLIAQLEVKAFDWDEGHVAELNNALEEAIRQVRAEQVAMANIESLFGTTSPKATERLRFALAGSVPKGRPVINILTSKTV
jgi:hypothetical protein